MFKNVASQKVALFAFDSATGLPKTGDGANITPYVSKDYGTVTVLGTTTATEMDATNAKGWYSFTLTQGETNADALLYSGKSSTSGISVVGALIYTTPNRFSSMVIDAAGLADANAVKLGPTGAGTAQTARDLGTSVLISSGAGTGQLDVTSGVIKANLAQILGTALTETAGLLAGGFKKFFNIATPAATMDHGVLVDTVTTTTTATTTTNLTNAPTSGDLTATMKASVTTAATAATPAVTVSDKTGFSLSAGGVQAIWDALTSALTTVNSIGKLLVTNIDALISSRTKPADTQAAVTTVTNLTNAPTSGDLTATMKTSVTTAASAATPAVTVSDKTGFSLSAGGIQAIWDALTSALTTVNSIGKLLATNIDALISSRTKPADTQAAVTTVTNLTNAPTSGDLTATMKASVTTAATAATPTAAAVTGAVGSVTGLTASNLDVAVSTRLPTSGYTAPDNSTISAINSKTTNLPSDPADASDIAAAFSSVNATLTTIAGYIDTEVAAIKAKTDNIPATPAAAGDAMTLTGAYDFAKGTSAMIEAYAANGVAPTPVQALFAIHQMLMHFGIVGTSNTVKKLDGAADAFIVTYDSATAPTSASRS